MNKKIPLFLITVLIVTMCVTSLIGSVMAGEARGKDKATWYAAGTPSLNWLSGDKVWLSPKWETAVYPPTYGSPEIVHYRGMEGQFGPSDLIVKIDGVELEMEVTCMMLMDVEIHKPKFPYPAGPFSYDFMLYRVTKTYTFEGHDGTIVTEINWWAYPDKPGHGMFNGYGTGDFKDVKITKGVAYTESGIRVDEGIIMGWPLP